MPRPRYLALFFLPAIVFGQQVTFATYQGGSQDESGAAIARDSLGNLYLAGTTSSANFPVTSAAGGGFVVKLDASGNRTASLLMPGVSISAVAVDSANNVVIAGAKSGTSGFISKLNSALSQTLWTNNIPASPAALAIDSTGIYATGSAASGLTTTSGAFQATNKGSRNIFVLKLSADGSTTIFATYLGGSGSDAASAIAVDSTGDVYLTGAATSSDFPLVHAAQNRFGGVVEGFETGTFGDAFVAKLDPKGATLLYSTYLGGAAADQGNAIAVDVNGNAYVVGATESAKWLAGAASGTFQTAFAGPDPDPTTPLAIGDAFLAKFSAVGDLAWYTYLGGSS